MCGYYRLCIKPVADNSRGGDEVLKATMRYSRGLMGVHAEKDQVILCVELLFASGVHRMSQSPGGSKSGFVAWQWELSFWA